MYLKIRNSIQRLKAIKNYFTGLRIRNYIAIILLSFFIVFVVFFAVFIKIYNASIEKNNFAYNRSIAESYSEKLNNAFSSLIDKANVLCANHELIDFVDSFGENMPQVSDPLFYTVHNFFLSNPNVYDIILTNGEYTKTFYMNRTDFAALPVLNPNDDTVKMAFANNNKVLLIPINIIKNMRSIGRCYLVVYQDMLEEALGKKMRIGNTKCFVMSQTMQIIAAPDNIENDQPLLMLYMLLDKTKGNEFVEKIGSDECFVNITALETEGIYFFNYTPCKSINSDYIQYFKTAIFLFTVAFLMFFVISFIFVTKLDNSISLLKTFIFEKKSGSPPKPDLFSQDLSSLADEIGDMTDSIKRLQNENFQIRMAQNESQLRVLQSQVNPHFLFNTLNCIIGMARFKKTEEIVNVATAMAQIMRYSLSDDLLAAFKNELETINYYLQIQQIRFSNRFTVEEEIDPSLLNEEIIRFSIQPLIENAVKYGLEPLEEGGKLRLIAVADGQDIVFKIIDNGSGFDDEIYTELKLRLSGDVDGKLNSKGFGTGILNIHKRIRLYYGDEYGVDVERMSQGTMVVVRIPKNSRKGFEEVMDE